MEVGTSTVGAEPARARWHDTARAAVGPSLAPLALMLLLVLLMAAFVGLTMQEAPVAPGVDPGHWLSVSYTYVGLPTAPDPTDRILSYPPLMFPFLGALVLATGSPVAAAEALAVAIFAGFGLSLIYLARRMLVAAPLQTALVGLGVLTGSTLQMLFWGGYPNLLGFALLNLTIVAFLAHLRGPSPARATAFFGLVALTFFAHDLTFAELVAILGLATLFLLLLRRIEWRFLFRPINLVGGAAVAAIVGGYTIGTGLLRIPHPGYFASNPSAYSIDEIGEMFAPLGHSPAFWPSGPTVYLPPMALTFALLAGPLFALLGLFLLRARAPAYCDTRLVVAAGWLSATLAVPAAGYLAHVDTDYTRFVYFLPVPFLLLVLLGLERAFLRPLAPQVAEALAPAPARPAPARARRRPVATGIAWVAVALALGFVFVTVTEPVVQANESSGTAAAHDADFLAAVEWLKRQPGNGTVLTVPSAARWTEALSDRYARAVGPVWLLFDPFQIASTQEAYWELSATEVLSNPDAAVSFSGFSSPLFSQAPMYTAYIDSVPFPVFRILSGSFEVNVTGPNGSRTVAFGGAAGTPQLLGVDAAGTGLSVSYPGSAATLVEQAAVQPNGSVTLALTVTPEAGVVVHTLQFTLATPPSNSPTLSTDHPTGVHVQGAELSWAVAGKLGQSPTPAAFTTAVRFSAAPASFGPAVVSGAGTYALAVADPNGSAPFTLSATIGTPGSSNPTDPLPTYLDVDQLLGTQSIAYLLWPIGTSGTSEPSYFAAAHGYRVGFANAEWEVLEAAASDPAAARAGP